VRDLDYFLRWWSVHYSYDLHRRCRPFRWHRGWSWAFYPSFQWNIYLFRKIAKMIGLNFIWMLYWSFLLQRLRY
jgi:hypothetical protein